MVINSNASRSERCYYCYLALGLIYFESFEMWLITHPRSVCTKAVNDRSQSSCGLLRRVCYYFSKQSD